MGVFSDLASDTTTAPFNTVTTPEQEAAEEAAASTSSGGGMKVFKRGNMPMQNIIKAVMRGAAAVQGQEQAKKVQSEQAASMSKFSLTLKPGPDGEPRVTIKDAPASLINGTQQDDLQKAYTTPGAQVEKKIAAMGEAQPATEAGAPLSPPAQDHPLQVARQALADAGINLPAPWDTDIAEKLKTEDGLRAIAEEMGLKDTKAEARRAFRQLQKGVATPEAVAQRIAEFRADRIMKKSDDLQSTLAPYEARKQREAIEADREADNKRLMQQLTNAEREKVLGHKMSIINDTDWSMVDPAEWADTAESMNTTGVPFSKFELNRLQRVGQQKIAKAFDAFTSNADRFALGTYDSWDEAKEAFGHPVDARQDAIGKARWEAAHTYVEKLATKDALKERNDRAHLERTLQIIRTATAEKPANIGRGDLALMPAAELIEAAPATIKNYDSALEQKEGLLRKELREATRKRDESLLKAKAINDTREFERQYGWRVDLAGFNFDVRAADEDVKNATADLERIRMKRAERRGTPIVAPPGTTETKPAAAPPQVKYKVGPGGKYIPQVEAGIEKHMNANNVGRAKAIEQLRGAGYLE